VAALCFFGFAAAEAAGVVAAGGAADWSVDGGC
jgi:hypothetical protein